MLAVMSIEMLGPYPFSFSDIFTVLSVRHNEPLHIIGASTAISGFGAKFDFAVVVGRGTDEERDELIAAMVDVLAPTKHEVEPITFQGNAFIAHHVDHVIGGHACTSDHFVGFAFADLLYCATTYRRETPDPEQLRYLALQTMCGAIVRHGPPSTAASRPGGDSGTGRLPTAMTGRPRRRRR